MVSYLFRLKDRKGFGAGQGFYRGRRKFPTPSLGTIGLRDDADDFMGRFQEGFQGRARKF
jgi:hypothetical protein